MAIKMIRDYCLRIYAGTPIDGNWYAWEAPICCKYHWIKFTQYLMRWREWDIERRAKFYARYKFFTDTKGQRGKVLVRWERMGEARPHYDGDDTMRRMRQFKEIPPVR